ncbi:MAG TPA: response regulator [Blastocatellia bacterium]|jgi:two-component system response regulator (stage 0 sporulation protein A)|nr:response regulator [Blastocatellia bacterium]
MDTVKTDEPDRQTLLIVDDDHEWTDVLKIFFLDKYDVEVVNSAREAIEVVGRKRPSVIIVDLVMPTIDGFGVIHRLNDSTRARIPTILLTGWKTAEVEECAASVGCAAVLSKPIDLAVLDEVVSAMMSRGAVVSASVM